MYKLDPSTDLMFVIANKSQVNPEATMQESLIEENVAQTETREEFECEESGDEYLQRCSKRRVIEIEIIPEKKEKGRCGGHPGNVKKRKTKHDNLSWCSPNSGCNAEKIIQPRKVNIIRDEWIDDCAILEEKADQGLCRYVEAEIGGSETRTIIGKVISPAAGKPETEAEPIARDSWVENYTYACMFRAKNGCETLRAKGCVQTKSTCIERVGEVCVAWKQTMMGNVDNEYHFV